MAKFTLKVNGKNQEVDCDPRTPLLFVLMHDLQLNGPRFGCGERQCGACTAIIDGNDVTTCTLPVSDCTGKDIQTLDGIGTPEKPHPLQTAFIAEQAAQCGYCLNGIMMSAKALLDRNPKPTQVEIKDALTLAMCRCGSHARMVRAVERASREMTR